MEEHPTHSGSLRVFAQRTQSNVNARCNRVSDVLEQEKQTGMLDSSDYLNFQAKVDRKTNEFLVFLVETKLAGKIVGAYGAAAKGNTIINYAGIRPDVISFVADRNPFNQGKILPGRRIPIVDAKKTRTDKPNYIIILPWNLKSEVMSQLDFIREWG